METRTTTNGNGFSQAPNLNSAPTLSNSTQISQSKQQAAQTAEDFDKLNRIYQEQQRRNAEQQEKEADEKYQDQERHYQNLVDKSEEIEETSNKLIAKGEEYNSLIERYNAAETTEEQAILKSRILTTAEEYNALSSKLQTKTEEYNRELRTAKAAGSVDASTEEISYRADTVKPEFQEYKKTEADYQRESSYNDLLRNAEKVQAGSELLEQKREKYNSLVTAYNAATLEQRETMQPDLLTAADEYNTAANSLDIGVMNYNESLSRAKAAGAVSDDAELLSYTASTIPIGIYEKETVSNQDTNQTLSQTVRPFEQMSLETTAAGLSLLSNKDPLSQFFGTLALGVGAASYSSGAASVSDDAADFIRTYIQKTPEQTAIEEQERIDNLFERRIEFFDTMSANTSSIPQKIVWNTLRETMKEEKDYYTKGLARITDEGIEINPPGAFTTFFGGLALGAASGLGIAAAIGSKAASNIPKATSEAIKTVVPESQKLLISGGGSAISETGTAVITANEAELIAKTGAAASVGYLVEGFVSRQQTGNKNKTALGELNTITDEYSTVYQKYNELRNKSKNRVVSQNSGMYSLGNIGSTAIKPAYSTPVKTDVFINSELPTSNKNAGVFSAAEINLFGNTFSTSESYSNKLKNEETGLDFDFAYGYNFGYHTRTKAKKLPDVSFNRKKRSSARKGRKDTDDYYLKVRSVITPKKLLGSRNELLTVKKKNSNLFTSNNKHKSMRRII